MALVDGLGGQSDADASLAAYEAARNEATLPEFHANLARAQLGPAPEEPLRRRAALRPDPAATRQFFLAGQGLVGPATFFNDEKIGRITGSGGRIRRSPRASRPA